MKDEELLKEAEKNILNLKNNSIKISGKPFQINEGDYRQGYLDGAEPREKKIEELETRCTEVFLQNNEFAERFEKSIEIIKGLLSCCRNYPQENAEKIEQAKQFLKEIEE